MIMSAHLFHRKLTPIIFQKMFRNSNSNSKSSAGTAGEWMEDPYGDFGQVPAGPGEKWFPPDHTLSSSL
jgi:hypothetical protein